MDSCICIEYGISFCRIWCGFLYSIYVEFSCIFLLSILGGYPGLFVALLDWDGWGINSITTVSTTK